ncbi:putative reverse transcriptase domain-containing protein, partial [Tanacetum coccineum]
VSLSNYKIQAIDSSIISCTELRELRLAYNEIRADEESDGFWFKQSTTWCIPKYQSRKEMAGNNGGKDGQITLHYPMLSRSNYAAWAIKMRVFMQAQGVWEAVEPRTANTVVEVKKDKMALAAIYQGIPEDLLLSFSEKKSAKEA